MVLLLVALVSAMGASPRLPALHVATEADAALRCPVNAALVSALALRLPSVRLASGKLEAEDLTAKLSPDLDAWRFEVRRAGGAIAMSRVLAAQADCAQVADTAALILERFLAEIDWRGRPVGIDPLQPETMPRHEKAAPPKPPGAPPRAPEPAATSNGARAVESARSEPAPRADPRPEPAQTPPVPAKPEPRAGRSSALEASGSSAGVEIVPGTSGFQGTEEAIGRTHGPAAPAAPEPAPAVALAAPVNTQPQAAPAPAAVVAQGPIAPGRRVLSRASVSAGGGGWLGLPKELSASFSLEVGATLLERVRLSLVLVASSLTGAAIADGRGSIQLQSFSGFLTATLCSSDRLSACGGVAAGAHVTRAGVSTTDARQHLYRTGSDVLALAAAGLYGRAAFTLVGGLEVSVDLAALIPFGSGSFSIEGFPAPYTTPAVELIAGLRLGWTFF